jgi:hypothetical protein
MYCNRHATLFTPVKCLFNNALMFQHLFLEVLICEMTDAVWCFHQVIGYANRQTTLAGR